MSVIITRDDDGDFRVFDATIEERYAPEVFVSSHPIPRGRSVTDHTQGLPLPFTIRVAATGTPFSVIPQPTAPSQVQNVINQLLQDWVDFLNGTVGQTVTVVSTKLGVFENVVLLTWPHTVTMIDGLTFDISCRQIEIAETGLVRIAPTQPPPSKQVEVPDDTDIGEQAFQGPLPEQAAAADDESWLISTFKAVGVID